MTAPERRFFFDRVLGIAAIVLALPVIAASYSYGIGSAKSPGAGFWPMVIAVVLAILGILLVVRPSPVKEEGALTGARLSKLVTAVGSLLFYVFALEPVGYPLATTALLFIQLRYVEERSGRLAGLIALMAAVISFLLFRVILKVMLPAGVIPLPRGW